MKRGRNRRQKGKRKIAVEKVKFRFTGDACIFKFNLKEGKIVSSGSIDDLLKTMPRKILLSLSNLSSIHC